MTATHFLAGIILVGTVAALSISDAAISGPARVIDGDTLQIGDKRIRLFGIDAPERSQPQGPAATAYLQRIIANVTVICHPRDNDRWGRIVAKCETVDGDIGRRMVANGMAVDVPRYSRGAYKDAEDAARTERLGIWAGTFVRPDEYRRHRPTK